MLKTAEENGVRIMNAFPMRFNPAVVEAKGIIDGEKLEKFFLLPESTMGKSRQDGSLIRISQAAAELWTTPFIWRIL